MLIVTSVGCVNFVKANPIAFPAPMPQVHWDFANNTVFKINNTVLNFTISINDTIFNTERVENLQPSYAGVKSVVTSVEYLCYTNYSSLTPFNYNPGSCVERGQVNASASGIYSVNLTGLPEGKYHIDLYIDCSYNYSEQFNQDIAKFYPGNKISDFVDKTEGFQYDYGWGGCPIYFSVATYLDNTNEMSAPMIAIGFGASLAVIVAVALLVVYKKRSLKLRV